VRHPGARHAPPPPRSSLACLNSVAVHDANRTDACSMPPCTQSASPHATRQTQRDTINAACTSRRQQLAHPSPSCTAVVRLEAGLRLGSALSFSGSREIDLADVAATQLLVTRRRPPSAQNSRKTALAASRLPSPEPFQCSTLPSPPRVLSREACSLHTAHANGAREAPPPRPPRPSAVCLPLPFRRGPCLHSLVPHR